MKFQKRLLAIIVIFPIIFILINVISFKPIYAGSEIKVKLNNKEVIFDTLPYSKNGRTLVPFRKILEAFGADVTWNAEKQLIKAVKSSTAIYLKIGDTFAYVNGNQVNLDVAPEITKGRTFVPLRFVSENLGADVKWESSTQTVFITYNHKTYKVGQEGSFNDFRFNIIKIDSTSEFGALIVTGKVNFETKDLVLEVADAYGYVIPAKLENKGKSDGMNIVEGTVLLPLCHDFEGKYLIIKKLNSDQKLVKIGEYPLN